MITAGCRETGHRSIGGPKVGEERVHPVTPSAETASPAHVAGHDGGMRTHGKGATYRKGGCRCPKCRAENTEDTRTARQKRAERLAEDPSLAPHGSRSTYDNWGCRCEECVVAHYAAAVVAYRAPRG